MLTLSRKKVRNPNGKNRNFISYFQSVTTIGIVSQGKSDKEAEIKSLNKLKNSEMTCGVVGHTPFTVAATEEWEPSFSGIVLKNSMAIDMNEIVRSKIAEKLNKQEVTNDDCVSYLKTLLEKSLQ